MDPIIAPLWLGIALVPFTIGVAASLGLVIALAWVSLRWGPRRCN
eukprot:gene8008-14887_t